MGWFSLGGCASPLYNSANCLFVSQGRNRQQLRFGFLTSVASIAGLAAGLPGGPVGVATGAGLSFSVIAVPLTCWGATREGPVKTSDLLAALLPIGAASIATILAVGALSKVILAYGPGMLILTAMIAYAAFLTAIACLPSGRKILFEAWRLTEFFGEQRRGRPRTQPMAEPSPEASIP
jgi:O-antigen/teichoic acid export membrane protein